MGCTQSAAPLWAAMISLSRQIGLLGAFHWVIGTGLGVQPYQIVGASWAIAGTRPKTRAAPSKKLRYFIKITPQTHVFLGQTMSQTEPQYNRASARKQV